MSLYRGTGGATSVSGDASVEQVLEAAVNADASATAAAASAAAASSSAGTASTAASNASTSASNAAASETAAGISETNAAASEAASEAALVATQVVYDSFDDRYLGSKVSAPTLDNDGNALLTGALYFDSVQNDMYVYTGSAWVTVSNTASSSAAATSASNAATSESNAATSESNAATSAANASTSETNAATSESNAASSAASAAASYDSFDDRYLGAKSSAPTLDNDNNALLTGALYFNSVDGNMYVYTGSVWVTVSNTASSSAAATSAANAATSETNAATSASNAATSASQASSSATAASSSASSASTSATNASNSATSAAASANSASGHKDLAYTYWQNAASAVTYSDLEAIATTKAVTAVDVFVYDTRKDSDGGAWRKRTQATSLYNVTLNTATRGARKEYPAVMVLVVTSTDLIVYDGDDPSLPMWASFPVGSSNVVFAAPTALAAMNGRIGVATGSGFVDISLLGDVSTKYTTGADQHYKAALAVGGAGWA